MYHVVFDEAFRHDDGVFVVVPVPRHERDGDVLSQSQIAVFHRRSVGQNLSDFDLIADFDDRHLVDAGSRVGTGEFLQDVFFFDFLFAVFDDDLPRIDISDGAVCFRHDRRARVFRDVVFQSGSHIRRMRFQQRKRLTLHVRAHQGTVRIVVFQKRNTRRSDGNDLFRRDVDIVDFFFLR